MSHTLTVVAAALLGLVFGSFATVVVWRVPRDESIVKPGSHCTGCGAEVKPYDNLPVISYLLLRGRCRSCQARIGLRYPLLELAVALLFVGVVYRLPGWAVPAYWALALALAILTVIDLEHRRLPVVIVYPALLAGAVLLVLAAGELHLWVDVFHAAIGGVGATLIFAAVFFGTRGGMGFGDVRLAGLCGMYLGFLGWRYLLVAFVGMGLVAAVVLIVLFAMGKATRKTALPFGPFLAAGTMIAVLYGAPLARLWLDHR